MPGGGSARQPACLGALRRRWQVRPERRGRGARRLLGACGGCPAGTRRHRCHSHGAQLMASDSPPGQIRRRSRARAPGHACLAGWGWPADRTGQPAFGPGGGVHAGTGVRQRGWFTELVALQTANACCVGNSRTQAAWTCLPCDHLRLHDRPPVWCSCAVGQHVDGIVVLVYNHIRTPTTRW